MTGNHVIFNQLILDNWKEQGFTFIETMEIGKKGSLTVFELIPYITQPEGKTWLDIVYDMYQDDKVTEVDSAVFVVAQKYLI